jgi:hypothetical protein
MRFQSIATGCASLLLATGLTWAGPASADYDKSVDFSKYKTYSWGKGTPARNPLAEERIVQAVDAQLQAKGWKKVEGQGDAVVSTHVAVEDRMSLDTMYSGWDYAWGWHGATLGTVTSTSYSYKVGTLLVDIFDSGKKTVIWRGTVEDTLPTKITPEKSEKKINAAVGKLFRSFPPATKKA